MPYPLPLTRTEAYLAYKAGVIQQSDLKPSLSVPRNGIDAWLAYWTGLAADYPKRDDGTPHILQEEEAYIAYLCGVINEYPEKCLRRVGAYLRYLISARWGRPDHPLNREELYLSLIKTQFIPSGDPSSDIVIDGTTKAPFVDVKLYGDTFQQSYTGKNLLKYPYWNTTTTTNGVTFTDNGDGSVTANGTASSQALFWVTSDYWRYAPESLVVPAGTYTIKSTGYSELRTIVTAYGKTQGLIETWQVGSEDASFTLDEEASLTVRLSVQSGATADNYTFRPQIEVGSTSSSYEPYVGGQPSPNPDYPQQIQTVTGVQTVEVHGKNLIYLEPNTGSPYLNGLSPSYDNQSGAIHIYGTPTDSWSNIGARTNLSLPAGTYTISATDNQQTHSKAVYAYHPDGTRTQFYIGPTEQFKTVTVSKPIVNYYIYISQMTIGEAIDDIFYIQLELGSTATTYAPYSNQTLPIDLGSIELCKLGTYQDYIWKDGDSWKVHKATKKVELDEQSGWTKNQYGTNAYKVIAQDISTLQTTVCVASQFFTGVSYDGRRVTTQNIVFADSQPGIQASDRGISIRNTPWSDTTSLLAWVASNHIIVYYLLLTPTDTVITDQNLINQLNALKQGGAEEGTTYIKVSATDPNLPAKLYVEAPKYD